MDAVPPGIIPAHSRGSAWPSPGRTRRSACDKAPPASEDSKVVQDIQDRLDDLRAALNDSVDVHAPPFLTTYGSTASRFCTRKYRIAWSIRVHNEGCVQATGQLRMQRDYSGAGRVRRRAGGHLRLRTSAPDPPAELAESGFVVRAVH